MNKLILGLLVALLLFIFGCVQQTEISETKPVTSYQKGPVMREISIPEPEIGEEKQMTQPETRGDSERTQTAEPKRVVKEFSITAKRFEFNPNIITVNEGDKVKLMITSIDVTHGFAIDEYGVNVRLNPSQEEVVEFIADKSGEFIFYCSVPCGSGHSRMSGKLIVK